MAKETNNCAAARKFDVHEKMVRMWRKSEDILKTLPKNKCALRTGTVQWPELENAVDEWIIQRRQSGYIVTKNIIKAEAMKWAISNRELSKNFHATSGWCSCFMKRKGLVLHQKTEASTKFRR